jgi:hypothetical protein
MWGNPMRERERERERERDLIIQLQESTYQQQIYNFQPREKPLTSPKIVPKFFASKNVPSPYCCMTCPKISSLKYVPIVFCTDCPVRPNNNKKNFLNSLENRAQPASIFVPSFPCCTECTDLYNMASNNRKIIQHSNINVPLGFVPIISWEMCPLYCPNFPLSSLLENLSQSPSLVSCTLSFYLPSVFSPSPTLNPKAKILSCLYKIKGHDSFLPK